MRPTLALAPVVLLLASFAASAPTGTLALGPNLAIRQVPTTTSAAPAATSSKSTLSRFLTPSIYPKH